MELLGEFGLRGKPWSVDEERQLRCLFGEGKNLDELSKVMGKTRVSVKAKMFSLGLKSVVVATGVGGAVAVTTVATTPARLVSEGNSKTYKNLAIKSDC